MTCWIHEPLVSSTIRLFCSRALPEYIPDARTVYRIEQVVPNWPGGRAFRIEVDLATTADDEDVWLTFVIDEPPLPSAPEMHDLTALRTVWHGDTAVLYRWLGTTGAWEQADTSA